MNEQQLEEFNEAFYGREKNHNLDVMNATETADYLRCSLGKVYDMAKRGVIPFVKMEGRILFRKLDIFNWLGTMQGGAIFNPTTGKFDPSVIATNNYIAI